MSVATQDSEGLKRLYKARCAQIGRLDCRSWQVRVHRSLSWLKQAQMFPEDQPEARFLYFWIAFNSLYSAWDAECNAPAADATSRRNFLRRLMQCDRAGVMAGLLRQHRPLLKKLLANPYLSERFWRDPGDAKTRGRATEDANYIEKHFREEEYETLLEQMVSRLSVFRGQIVHGASSRGSHLNRTTLNYCLKALEQFVPAIIGVVIEQGCSEDWPALCYPPVA